LVPTFEDLEANDSVLVAWMVGYQPKVVPQHLLINMCQIFSVFLVLMELFSKISDTTKIVWKGLKEWSSGISMEGCSILSGIYVHPYNYVHYLTL